MSRTALRCVGAGLAIASIAVAVSGCGSSGSNASTSTATSTGTAAVEHVLQAHEWVLDRGSSSLTAPNTQAITVRFAPGGVLSGVGPCNAYRGTYALGGDAAIRISDISQTLRACDARTDAAEREYVAALQSVNAITALDARHLSLGGPSDARLSYDALDVASAVVGTWDVTNVSRDDAIRGVTEGLHPSLAISTDGSVVYASACGRREGRWTLAGDQLTISTLAPTAGSCATGTPAASDDAAIAAALAGTTTVDVAPGMLTLLDADGHILIVATR